MSITRQRRLRGDGADERCLACAIYAAPSSRREDFGQCGGTAPSAREACGVDWCAALAERRAREVSA